MKILQKSQIQEADRQTICLEPIASIELMERAAKACFQWICQHYNTDQKFTLLCGTGNNGGDGLALYRMLLQKKYSCTLFEFPLGKTPGEDYSQNKLKIGKENINALTSESLSKILNCNINLFSAISINYKGFEIKYIKKTIKSQDQISPKSRSFLLLYFSIISDI